MGVRGDRWVRGERDVSEDSEVRGDMRVSEDSEVRGDRGNRWVRGDRGQGRLMMRLFWTLFRIFT